MREGCIAYCFSLPSLFFCFCFGFFFFKAHFHKNTEASSRHPLFKIFLQYSLNFLSKSGSQYFSTAPIYIALAQEDLFSLSSHQCKQSILFKFSLSKVLQIHKLFDVYTHTHEGSNTCSNVFSSYVRLITC
jgi:hypothetical protein